MPAPPDRIYEWANENRDKCIVCDGPRQDTVILCAEHNRLWLEHKDSTRYDEALGKFKKWFIRAIQETYIFCGNCGFMRPTHELDYLCPECRSAA